MGIGGEQITNNNIVLVEAKLAEKEWEKRYSGGNREG